MPPSPNLFSTLRLLILENFESLPFYSRLPVYKFMCTVDSVAWSLGKATTLFVVHVVSSTLHKIVFWLPWRTTWREEENRAKEQVILHVDKLPLYFLCFFCWYFHKIVWWFYLNEICNCCVIASLPVYSASPSIWKSRVTMFC